MTRILFFILFPLMGMAQTIEYDHTCPPAVYAAERLQKALANSGTRAGNRVNAAGSYTIRLIIDSTRLNAESYSIDPGPQKITITGGDARGLIYGSLSLAEAAANGQALARVRPSTEQPHLPFRGIKFDLPWDTYRHSYALDQHIAACRDTLFWQAFLDMMVDNRFNALTLWNLHPYPFMIRARNFPEACPFSDAELKEWQTLFHSIFRMARQRCIDTYLIPFNIFVSPEFARAHQVALDNLSHHFFVSGDTAGIIKRYTKESVTQVLEVPVLRVSPAWLQNS
ncbi:MAG TPA: glycoside hydrolase family 20 zincin-like fold domain-containing protein [Puia sp.]